MKISRQILLLVFIFSIALNLAANDNAIHGTNINTPLLSDSEKTQHSNEYNIGEIVKAYLETMAEEYAVKGYRSEYSVGNIDPYHMLKRCNTAPDISTNRPPLNQTRITTEVKCTDSQPWKLYVNSEFNLYNHIVVAASNIRRGQVITALDLELKETIINKSHYSFYGQLNDVVGMVAKRTIRAESNIQPNFLRPPKLVKRGDNVVIVASNSAISVKMNGTALSDGALGQQISVQNLQSKRVVKARVSSVGRVTITL